MEKGISGREKGAGVLLVACRFRCVYCELIARFVCGGQPRCAFSTSAVKDAQKKTRGQEVWRIDCSHPERANLVCRTRRRRRELTRLGGAAGAGGTAPADMRCLRSGGGPRI